MSMSIVTAVERLGWAEYYLLTDGGVQCSTIVGRDCCRKPILSSDFLSKDFRFQVAHQLSAKGFVATLVCTSLTRDRGTMCRMHVAHKVGTEVEFRISITVRLIVSSNCACMLIRASHEVYVTNSDSSILQ